MTDYIVIDLETTGFSSDIHEIIEIGAYKVVNNVAVEQFTTLVRPKCYIPRNIETITGITNEMTKDAPHIENILPKLYEWQKGLPLLGHNLGFDYEFLSQALENCGYGYLYNPRLCTIKLSQKLIQAPRYSLGFLNTFLNINHSNLHRALQDSKTALEVFKICLENLPSNLYTSNDLLEFGKNPKANTKGKRWKTP